MGFEVFSRKSAARTKSPWFTIQRRGTISMNGTAAKMVNLGAEVKEQLEVDLLYDTDRKIVGMRKALSSTNPYLLRRQGTGDVYLVAGKLYCDHYGIDTTSARRYAARDYGEGIIGICLDEEYALVERKNVGADS